MPMVLLRAQMGSLLKIYAGIAASSRPAVAPTWELALRGASRLATRHHEAWVHHVQAECVPARLGLVEASLHAPCAGRMRASTSMFSRSELTCSPRKGQSMHPVCRHCSAGLEIALAVVLDMGRVDWQLQEGPARAQPAELLMLASLCLCNLPPLENP